MAGVQTLTTPEPSWQIRRVHQVLIHPKYRDEIVPVNDVALLQVEFASLFLSIFGTCSAPPKKSCTGPSKGPEKYGLTPITVLFYLH